MPSEGAGLPRLCEGLRSRGRDEEQICGSGGAAAVGCECRGAGAVLCLDCGRGGTNAGVLDFTELYTKIVVFCCVILFSLKF